ncbi:MAG: hypothetical protein KAT43_00270 [Nanoarchaeota archaeon]|nr:hypothetical protein [Nanoarchaeota archaeon]
MSKLFIVTGLDGLIVNSDIFSKAHEAWFDHFCAVLGDESFKELMHQPNYWDAVYEIMEKQLGLSREIPEEAAMLRKFARETYRSLVIRFAEQYRKEDILLPEEHRGTIDVLKSLKDRATLMLLTTTPGDVLPFILKKMDCEDLYDDILSSKLDAYPSAVEIYEKFRNRELRRTSMTPEIKPDCYIGSSKRTIEYFKGLDVPTVFPSWTMSAEDQRETCEAFRIADYTPITACMLKQVLENLLKPSQ